MNKKEQGKKNRADGKRFEDRVRKDLEKKGWIVDRFTNNVEIYGDLEKADNHWGCKSVIKGKLIPAKAKIRFSHMGPILMNSHTGFVDFVCFKPVIDAIDKVYCYEVEGIECKTNGRLDKEEKFKCEWLLANNIFQRIKVAKKGIKRGKIEYVEFSSTRQD